MFALQLEFIQYLHRIRTPLLDHLIKLCDFFDKQEFLFIFIPIVWLGFGWKWGMRIFYLLALSHVINYGLKNLFSLPRPFHLDPNVGIIQVKGYGFPSGAAQTTIILSGLLLMYWKSIWKWVVAITYTTILSFSRVYLGVHFPLDILGGWIVGLLLLEIYIFTFPKIERFFEQRLPLQSLLISYFLLLALMFCSPSRTIINICACGIGLGTGVFINRWVNPYQPIRKTKLGSLVRILIGILGVFIVHSLIEKAFNLQSLINEFLLFISIGLWISFGTLYICDRLVILWTKES